MRALRGRWLMLSMPYVRLLSYLSLFPGIFKTLNNSNQAQYSITFQWSLWYNTMRCVEKVPVIEFHEVSRGSHKYKVTLCLLSQVVLHQVLVDALLRAFNFDRVVFYMCMPSRSHTVFVWLRLEDVSHAECSLLTVCVCVCDCLLLVDYIFYFLCLMPRIPYVFSKC